MTSIPISIKISRSDFHRIPGSEFRKYLDHTKQIPTEHTAIVISHIYIIEARNDDILCRISQPQRKYEEGDQ
jgi:deoxyadenosine/deoxycytidine kinase